MASNNGHVGVPGSGPPGSVPARHLPPIPGDRGYDVYWHAHPYSPDNNRPLTWRGYNVTTRLGSTSTGDPSTYLTGTDSHSNPTGGAVPAGRADTPADVPDASTGGGLSGPDLDAPAYPTSANVQPGDLDQRGDLPVEREFVPLRITPLNTDPAAGRGGRGEPAPDERLEVDQELARLLGKMGDDLADLAKMKQLAVVAVLGILAIWSMLFIAWFLSRGDGSHTAILDAVTMDPTPLSDIVAPTSAPVPEFIVEVSP